MITKHSIVLLTNTNAVLEKINLTEEGIRIGEINRTGYTNSITGRELAHNNIPEPYLSAIMLVWGGAPSVDETMTE